MEGQGTPKKLIIIVIAEREKKPILGDCSAYSDPFFFFKFFYQGTEGLEAHVNENFDNAEYFTETIRNRPGFKLVLEEPEYTNITFWYVPPSLRGRQNEPDFKDKLHKVRSDQHPSDKQTAKPSTISIFFVESDNESLLFSSEWMSSAKRLTS